MPNTVPENSIIYIVFPTQLAKFKPSEPTLFKIKLEPDPGGVAGYDVPNDKVKCAYNGTDFMYSNVKGVSYTLDKPWESLQMTSAKVITVEGITNPASTERTKDFWIIIVDDKDECIAVNSVLGIKMGDQTAYAPAKIEVKKKVE